MSTIQTANHIPSFEKLEFYPGLSVIREKSSKGIIGYVNKHPYEAGWFYFIKDFVSEFYDTESTAIHELLQHFLSIKYDKVFQNNNNLIQK